MRLIVDKSASKDLDDIGTWIAKDNPGAASRVLLKILQTIEQLSRFPQLSRSGRAHGTRERVVAGTSYIVVFEIWDSPATVVVTAIAHGARNR